MIPVELLFAEDGGPVFLQHSALMAKVIAVGDVRTMKATDTVTNIAVPRVAERLIAWVRDPLSPPPAREFLHLAAMNL